MLCVAPPVLHPDLLEGSSTSPDRLQVKGELSQFWRVLAGCVAPNGVNDGRRVDLLGCRVLEAPREGAALLKVSHGEVYLYLSHLIVLD